LTRFGGRRMSRDRVSSRPPCSRSTMIATALAEQRQASFARPTACAWHALCGLTVGHGSLLLVAGTGRPPASPRPEPPRSPGADRQGPQQRRHRPAAAACPQDCPQPGLQRLRQAPGRRPRPGDAPRPRRSSRQVAASLTGGTWLAKLMSTPSAQSTPTPDAHPAPHSDIPHTPPAYALAITLHRAPPALRSTRNRPRTPVRQGASWTAAYHRQLTIAAVARPIHSSVAAPAFLLLSGPGCCSP
jgi:hypothetical protein